MTSTISFNVALTTVKTTLKQCWDNVISTLKRHFASLKKCCVNVAQSCFNVVSTSDTDIVSTLCKVENPTLGFISSSISDQR